MTDYCGEDVRGGHSCNKHEWVDPGHCGICHERQTMIEVAVVFDTTGKPLFWPQLQGTGASIPDSRSLWEVIWEKRAVMGGIAHTHPWTGRPAPSGTDLTTFAAIELGLGTRLVWPIVTMDHFEFFGWVKPPEGPGFYGGGYCPGSFGQSTPWLETVLELRRRSQQGG